MELNNEFRVAVPAAKTWEVFTDVERVAPCLPGATLLSVDGDEFTGAVKVKVGPITVSYKGDAAFVEKDAAAQRMVLKANGKETRGNGNAAAVVTAQLKDEGDSTNVGITTDLTISGKAAQFGRGVLADVAGNLIAQFAKSLEADLLGGSAPRPTHRRRRPDAPLRQPAARRRRLRRPAEGRRSADGQTGCAGAGRAGGRRRDRFPAGPPKARDTGGARRRPAGRAVAARVMKAAAFAYHRPDAVNEAVDLLAEYGDDAKILAGGQSLVPMLAMRLTHFDNLVDISRIDELVGIDLCDSEVRIGAATPHAFVGMDDEVADSVPLLTLATPYIGHFQIRTRGTLGGAIAHADPAAEYAAVALALDARMEAVSPRGRRRYPGARVLHRPVGELAWQPTRSSLPCASRCGAPVGLRR